MLNRRYPYDVCSGALWSIEPQYLFTWRIRQRLPPWSGILRDSMFARPEYPQVTQMTRVSRHRLSYSGWRRPLQLTWPGEARDTDRMAT